MAEYGYALNCKFRLCRFKSDREFQILTKLRGSFMKVNLKDNTQITPERVFGDKFAVIWGVGYPTSCECKTLDQFRENTEYERVGNRN